MAGLPCILHLLQALVVRHMPEFVFHVQTFPLEDDQTQGGSHLPRTKMSDGCAAPAV
jgi:hypothetical protein